MQHSYSEWSPSHLYGGYNPYWQNVIISSGQMILFIRQVGDAFLTSQLFFSEPAAFQTFVLSFPNTPGFSQKISPDVDQNSMESPAFSHGIFP